MEIDGITELEDAEFDDVVDRHIDLWAIGQQIIGLQPGYVDRQIDLCIAAADMAGGEYPDPERDWHKALADLRSVYWRTLREEGVSKGLETNAKNKARAEYFFSERYLAAVARWDQWAADEQPDQETDSMATKTTKPAKRTPRKSPSAEKLIVLRIEKRLKITGSVELLEMNDSWGWRAEVCDAKRKADTAGHHGGHPSELAAAGGAFAFFWTWLANLAYDGPAADKIRVLEAQAQIEEQAQALDPGWQRPGGDVPETQPEAAAKEAAAGQGPLPGASLVNGQSTWICPECQSHNDSGVTVCHGCDYEIPSPSQPAPPNVESLRVVETILIDPDQALDHPFQPRTQYVGIDQLGESMATNGQLDDAWGRRLKNGQVELIRGHRRKRAALFKGLQLRVRIVECSDQQALELIGIDDASWEAFDALARGRWYKSMLEALGISQRDLAKRIGKSQADIGNHVRMLELPADWLQLYSGGKVTATMLRIVSAWSGRPVVLDAMRSIVEVAIKNGEEAEWTTEGWRDCLTRVLHRLTLPCESGEYYHGEFGSEKKKAWKSGYCRLTKQEVEQHRAELDIEDIPDFHSDDLEPRAFNQQRWFELNGNAEKRYQQQQEKKDSKGKSGAKSAGETLTPAEQKQREAEKRKEQAEQLKRKLQLYKVAWYQRKIMERLGDTQHLQLLDETLLIQLLLYFASAWNAHRKIDALPKAITAGRGKVSKRGYGVDRWKSIQSLKDHAALVTCVRTALTEWLSHDPWNASSDLDHEDVPAIAQALGIDMAKEWRCEQAFLELFRKADLLKLYDEWKLINTAADDKLQSLQQDLLNVAAGQRLHVPKCLL